jgi:hypothetical protein
MKWTRRRDGLAQRIVKDQHGRLMKQIAQPDASVKAVLNFTHNCRTNGEKGGVGSKDVRFLANIPMAAYGQWSHDWRMKGGLAGTGMKCKDYIILQASLPEHSNFVSTPSGKTGMERQARRKTFGWKPGGLDIKEIKQRPQPIVTEAK